MIPIEDSIGKSTTIEAMILKNPAAALAVAESSASNNQVVEVEAKINNLVISNGKKTVHVNSNTIVRRSRDVNVRRRIPMNIDDDDDYDDDDDEDDGVNSDRSSSLIDESYGSVS